MEPSGNKQKTCALILTMLPATILVNVWPTFFRNKATRLLSGQAHWRGSAGDHYGNQWNEPRKKIDHVFGECQNNKTHDAKAYNLLRDRGRWVLISFAKIVSPYTCCLHSKKAGWWADQNGVENSVAKHTIPSARGRNANRIHRLALFNNQYDNAPGMNGKLRRRMFLPVKCLMEKKSKIETDSGCCCW